MTWKTILPNCFKLQKDPSFLVHQKVQNQSSSKQQLLSQRLSISDFESNLSLTSDISSSVLGLNLHNFTLSELKLITHNFAASNFLGEGGFGPVHKGFVDDKVRPGLEAQPVAVKLLDLDGNQGHKEWLAEVIFLGQLRHPHIVKLIGYCCEDEQRLLVYEYMARGSLENQLFRRCSISLPWLTRLKIAVGAAKGLAFLHGEEKPVIYRDFKASNILLDSDYTAKLSDFGLAKDGPEGDDTHVTTRVMGTHGYAAPEYIMTGHLTNKSDVYSFGVVLLELITGRRAMYKSGPNREQSLVEWAKPFMRDTNNIRFDRIMDPKLEGQYSVQGARKAIAVANQCLSQQPKWRPTMIRVVKTLEPLLELDDVPVGSLVYVAHNKVEKEGGESVKQKDRRNEEEREVENGRQNSRKTGRRRHKRKLRSRAVYSDTALYTTLKNGSTLRVLKREEGDDLFKN